MAKSADHPLFSPRTRGMCFCPGYPSKVAPLRCPLRFTGASSKHVNSDFWCKSTAFF